jgi:hypothetical protein
MSHVELHNLTFRIAWLVSTFANLDFTVFFIAIFVVVDDDQRCHFDSSVLWCIDAVIISSPFQELVIPIQIAHFKAFADLCIHILFRVQLKRQRAHGSAKLGEELHIFEVLNVHNLHHVSFVRSWSIFNFERALVQLEVSAFNFHDFQFLVKF